MISYPANLPVADHTAYSGNVDFGLLRTELPTSRAAQNFIYNRSALSISMTFSMLNTQYEEWLNWVLANAYDWFEMDVIAPSEGVPNITTLMRCRFAGNIDYLKKGDGWLGATVLVEAIPYA